MKNPITNVTIYTHKYTFGAKELLEKAGYSFYHKKGGGTSYTRQLENGRFEANILNDRDISIHHDVWIGKNTSEHIAMSSVTELRNERKRIIKILRGNEDAGMNSKQKGKLEWIMMLEQRLEREKSGWQAKSLKEVVYKMFKIYWKIKLYRRKKHEKS